MRINLSGIPINPLQRIHVRIQNFGNLRDLQQKKIAFQSHAFLLFLLITGSSEF